MKLPAGVSLKLAETFRWVQERGRKLDFDQVPFKQLADAVEVSKKAGMDSASAARLDKLIQADNRHGLAAAMTELYAQGKLPGNWEVSVSSSQDVKFLGKYPAQMLKQTPVYTPANVTAMNEASTSMLQHLADLRARLTDGLAGKLPKTIDAAADQLTDVVRGLHQDYARVSVETVKAWITNGLSATAGKPLDDVQAEKLFGRTQDAKRKQLNLTESPGKISTLAKMFVETSRLHELKPSEMIAKMETLRELASEVGSLSMVGPKTMAQLKRMPSVAALMTDLLSIAIQRAVIENPAELKAFFDRDPALAREQFAKALNLDLNQLPSPETPWNALFRELETKGYKLGSVPGEEVVEIHERGKKNGALIGYVETTGFPGGSRSAGDPTIYVRLFGPISGEQRNEISAMAQRIAGDTGVKLALSDR